MKKYLTLILLCSLCLGFAACGNDDKEDIETPQPKFVWEGDMKNYNPLQGLWRYQKNKSAGLYFTEEKFLYGVTFHSESDTDYTLFGGTSFEINEKAYKYHANAITRYKLEGDNLTTYPHQNNDDEPAFLKKIK